MLFSEVVGQTEVKQLLLSQVRSGRLPHALMLAGDTGYGTLALALALANYVLCQNSGDKDSCDDCSSCKKVKKLIHPDLHFSFPFIKKSDSTNADNYMKDWLAHLTSDKYFDLNDWLTVIGAENKQAVITNNEGDNIIRKLSLTSYEGGYKIMIIWLPEKMNISAANTLLKTLEEPTKGTLFILCSEKPEELLTTIQSRVQRIDVPPLKTEDLEQALTQHRGLDKDTARQIARTSGGSYLKALRQLCSSDDTQEKLAIFKDLMRNAYSVRLKDLMAWTERLCAMGREEQKSQLIYMQSMVRENFMYNFGRPELNYMNPQELAFAKNFARFINERNVIGFYRELSRAQRDISANVNSRTVLYNLALQTIILLKK